MTTTQKRRPDLHDPSGAQKTINHGNFILPNSGIVNLLKLACIIVCRDALISVAVPMNWPAWADRRFLEMTERIEMLRGEVRA